MKIYIVSASSGSHDDWRTWIASIHTDLEKAKESRKAINQEYENRKHLPPPFPVDHDRDLIDTEKYTDEQFDTYHKWWWTVNDAEEYNGADIREYELDMQYEKWQKTIEETKQN